jgi:predicted membrane channel-forming protein YqfA (hemolysin III family)
MVSRTSSFVLRWVFAPMMFALSVAFNAAILSLLASAMFAAIFVNKGEGWDAFGLMWLGSLFYIAILSAASSVTMRLIRDSHSTSAAALRYSGIVLLVAGSGTALTWLAGPITPGY